MRQPAIVLSFVALTLTGCGVSAAPSVMLTTPAALQSSALRAPSAPATKEDFVKAVAALGVRLTDDQLAIISSDRVAKPNGTWAPRPAANLTGDQNLQTHFLKHGSEFHPAFATAQDYLAQAMALANGKRGPVQYYFDTTSFAKGYQSNIVIWNHSTREMTALRPDGAMTTFYHNNSLAASRFVEVPIF